MDAERLSDRDIKFSTLAMGSPDPVVARWAWWMWSAAQTARWFGDEVLYQKLDEVSAEMFEAAGRTLT